MSRVALGPGLGLDDVNGGMPFDSTAVADEDLDVVSW